MHKTKKNLLGLAGLAIIGLMTIVALNMPIMGASATNSGDVDVHVTVTPDPTKVESHITAPADGVTIVNGKLNVSASYSQVQRLVFYLGYKDKSGNLVWEKDPINEFIPTETSGIHSFEYDLPAGKFGDYTVKMQAYYAGISVPTEDTVIFTYGSISPSVDPSDTKPGKDPVIDVDIADDVDYVEVIVLGPDGKPVMVDKDGNPIPIKVNKDDVGADGKLHITLPFDKYGLPAGDYTIIVTGFDKNGNVLSTSTAKVPYQSAGNVGPTNPTGPATPNTPNTGSPFLGDLNISHLDYILSGVAVFTVVAGFALYLVFRKNRR